MTLSVLRRVAWAVLFSGCSILPSPSHAPGNRAFIVYWPPEAPGQLKLAVKDNIDIQGVVTTAGSGFFVKHAPPARKDAARLALARERKGQNVGQTKLSEIPIAPPRLH